MCTHQKKYPTNIYLTSASSMMCLKLKDEIRKILPSPFKSVKMKKWRKIKCPLWVECDLLAFQLLYLSKKTDQTGENWVLFITRKMGE